MTYRETKNSDLKKQSCFSLANERILKNFRNDYYLLIKNEIIWVFFILQLALDIAVRRSPTTVRLMLRSPRVVAVRDEVGFVSITRGKRNAPISRNTRKC